MKRIACMLMLGCSGGFAFGQAQPPAPNSMPDPGRLFQLPETPAKPEFKLQIPRDGLQALLIPKTAPLVLAPQAPPSDPAIVRRPHGFTKRQPRSAEPHKIYPDLKVLPVEIARLDAPAIPASPSGFEPIPRFWPHAKIEPIPITWQGYRMVPVTAPAENKPPAK